MIRPRKDKGDVTGDNLRSPKRGKKGGLTGSKHFAETNPEVDRINQENDAKAREAVQEHFKNVGQAVGNAIGGINLGSNNTSPTGGFNTSSLASNNLISASSIASQYGVQEIDVKSLIGSDPYKADGDIPEMSAKEANAEKLKIQRQNNALEVRHEKIKQGRKVAQMAREQMSFIGDLVDIETAKVQVAEKVVNYQIADTKLATTQSKLEEQQELLTQQQIRTQGTQSLTPGIRQEWQLKFDKQQRANERLAIEVEGAAVENDRKREELEAKLLGN